MNSNRDLLKKWTRSFRIKLRLYWIKLNQFASNLSNFFILIGIFLLFIIIGILIIFTLTQISIIFFQTPLLKPHADYILRIFRIDPTFLSEIQYVALLSSAVNAMAVIVTLSLAVISGLDYRKYKSDLKRQSIVKKKPVYIDCVDDLDIMLEYYKQAQKVTVFAGDFSWLTRNNDLKNEIVRLANDNKISLISYKSRQTVKNHIDDVTIFDLLEPRFRFDSNKIIRCSLVEKGGSKVFLYKSDQRIIEGEINVCIVYGKDEGQYLLEIIEQLSKG